jgi:hypothetical protein
MADSLWGIEDGQLQLKFHPGQAKAWRSKARFTWVLAGTQSGKTSFGPWWLWKEIKERSVPEGGTNDFIAATASYDLFKLKMLPELRSVFEHVLQWGRYWSGDRIIELSDPATGEYWAKRADDQMWGRIVLRSAASGGGLESLTARGAWLDECGQDEFGVETWEAIQRRISLYQGRILGTTTPYNLGWMKTEVYDKWTGGDPIHNVIQFPSYFNPLFDRAEFERAKASMPLHRFLLFYCGEFAKPPGLIYDCFDEDIHVVRPFPIPASWPRYVGIDFGAVNTALLWIAHDMKRDIYFAYRESLEGGMSTHEHCERAKSYAQSENVAQWLGGAPSEEQQRMDWQNEQIPVTRPFISDVEAGIMRPYGLFKTKRLYVFETLRGLRDEVGTYKRKLDDHGQPTEEIADKRKFHRLDALRYVASGLEDGKVQTGPGIL